MIMRKRMMRFYANCTMQARISIWSLLASSSTHRDALIKALKGLIYFLTADRATCIVFFDDDLPPEGSDHVRPLFIDVACSGCKVSSVLLDNDFALNRTVMGTLTAHVMIGLVRYSVLFQKVKFIHEGRIITIQFDRDVVNSVEPVLQISHSEDDLHLIGLEDDSRDMVPMSFDQYNSTLALNMMRGMTYLPGLGLGRRQHGSHEFTFTVDHDIPYGLGYTPIEEDACYMARLRKDRVRACLSGVQFDYPLRPYIFQLTDYFVRGSNHAPHMDMIKVGHFLDAVLHGPHFDFDLFGVYVIDTDDVTLYDACTDEMDMISTSRILDAAPHGPRFALDMFRAFMLEIDDDDSVTVVTPNVITVEGASDSMDPPLSFGTMSGFVTRFDDMAGGNINDMSVFEDLDYPLSDQSDFNSDSEERKVTPVSSSTELGAEIGTSLSPNERSRLIDLLRSYLDVFAWSYEDMPSLDPSIVQHHLPIMPHARPKQLSVGFLSVVKYPEWLANVVPVPKKDGKVRVCVDFRDLNKASPKDDFPLPHIDMLVDSTVGHSMLSFMDGISRYNQILMAPKDMKKTSFITEWGTYCYWVMPFGLKNARATYQRATTTLFHDMMHRDVEVYVDDMIVNLEIGRTLSNLTRFFERIRQFRLRLNPKKCIFGVASWKLLGHIISERGIVVDPEKIRAILDMPTLRTEREIEGFLGILQDIVVSLQLADICEPIFYLARKSHLRVSPFFSDLVPHTPVALAFVLVDVGHCHGMHVKNQFTDALATLASMIEIPMGVTIRPLLIETRSTPAYCCLIGDIEDQDGLPWYHDIYQFMSCGAYLESAIVKDRRALRQLATRFVIYGESLEVHVGVCGLHMLARKIMRTGYFWLTMEADYCQFVQRCPEFACTHIPLAIFNVGIDIIGKISPKSSSRHEYILVAIDYFTKWTNGAVEAADKNIKWILRKMLPFSLWAYRISFRTSTRATPYSLVYGMEAVLPVEIEMGSLRVALEQ
ncbi:hypothetical protein AAG906_017437 [Vitis piasezkii]